MYIPKLLFLILLSCNLFADESISEATKKSVVKITVTTSEPNYTIPWQAKEPKTSTGSGVLIRGNYILTCAHVALGASYISIQKYDEVKKYAAKVKWIDNEVDLALLQVDDKEFYKEMEPIKIGTMPKRGDSVSVLGYPMGGDDLSLTQGVVSRIEDIKYVHGYSTSLAVQIDAAINPGNSGGPALNSKNEIIGIAMQNIKESSNIGYIVPSVWIEHFLKDISDGHYDGEPFVGIAIDPMENEALRNYYKMGDRSGVLIKHISSKNPNYPLSVGDVILAMDGIPIQNDKSIRTNIGKVELSYHLQQKQVGEKTVFTIYRDQKVLDVTVTLEAKKNLVKNIFDAKAKYFIYGGIVFMPVTFNFSRENQEEIPAYFYDAMMNIYNESSSEQEELVAIRMILPHEINSGYQDKIRIIRSLNGEKIKNFKEFVNTLKSYNGKFIQIETPLNTIILDTAEVKKANAEILTNYGIEVEGVY
jgi:S1-C subfamily serine protease